MNAKGFASPHTSQFDADCPASENSHIAQIAARGEAYISAAMSPNRPPSVRGAVLTATLSHLLSTGKTGGRSQRASMHLSQSCYQESVLENAAAANIDEKIPIGTLLDGLHMAVEAKALPILVKLLCVISQMQVVPNGNCSDSSDFFDENQSMFSNTERRNAKRGSYRSAGNARDSYQDDPGDDSNDDADSLIDEDAPLLELKNRKRSRSAISADDRKFDRRDVSRKPRLKSCAGNGQEFVNNFLEKLAQATSQAGKSRRDDIFVANVIREASISARCVTAILNLLLQRLPNVDLFELPTYVYQLILIASTKGNSKAKRNTLSGVVCHFARLEASARIAIAAASQAQDADEDDIIICDTMSISTLRQVQGILLLHMDFAVKQDPALATELCKLARAGPESPQSVMTLFGISVLLVISRNSSYQDSVFNMLSDAVTRHDLEESRRRDNPFVFEVCHEDDSLPDIRLLLQEAVESAAKDGWDIVCEPLIHFGFRLMDRESSSKKPVGAGKESFLPKFLSKLFDAHPSIRGQLVEQLVSRIILQEPSCSCAISAFSVIAHTFPAFLLHHVDKLKDCLSDTVLLPSGMARRLFTAFKPLLRVRPDFHDFTILCLRKSLFHPDTAVRAVACTSFLRLIFSSEDDFGDDPMDRHASSSQQFRFDDNCVVDLVQPLRRVLTNSFAVRALFYREVRSLLGMYPGTERCDNSYDALRSLLHPHALEFLNASESPFINLNQCVDEGARGRVVEPLGDLVSCLTAVEISLGKPLSNSYLMDLAKKVASVALDDFDVTKNNVSDSNRFGSDENDEGTYLDGGQNDVVDAAADIANRNRIRILGATVEALLNVALCVEDEAHSSKLYLDVVFPLLHLRDEAFSLLKRLGGDSASSALSDLGRHYQLDSDLQRTGRTFSSKGNTLMHGNMKERNFSGSSKKLRKNSNGAPSKPAETVTRETDFRLGAFCMLMSSASFPAVQFRTALECLRCAVSCSTFRQIDNGDRRKLIGDWFVSQRDSEDLSRLSAYLFAVVKAHIDHCVDRTAHAGVSSLPMSMSNRAEFAESLCEVANVAMSDFQSHRGKSGLTHSKGAIRALELVESCFSALCTLFHDDFCFLGRLCESILPSDDMRQRTCEEATSRGSVLFAVESLQELCGSLIDDGISREAAVVIRIMRLIQNLYSNNASCDMPSSQQLGENAALWAKTELLRCTTKDLHVLKSLAALATNRLALHTCLSSAQELALRVRVVLGDCVVTDREPARAVSNNTSLACAESIQQHNALLFVDIVLDALDAAFEDNEWCVARVSTLEGPISSGKPVKLVSNASPPKLSNPQGSSQVCADALAEKIRKTEDAGLSRLKKAVEILNELLQAAIAKWAHEERLLKSVIKCYKTVSLHVNVQLKRHCEPRTSFVHLLASVKLLSPLVWNYISFLSNNEGKETDATSTSKNMSHAVKEARIMPQVVYEAEKLEKLLISVQKHSRTDLLSGIKRNTARDYKIFTELLVNDNSNTDEPN